MAEWIVPKTFWGMAEWRKQIAEFNHPQGASIVVVNANGDCIQKV